MFCLCMLLWHLDCYIVLFSGITKLNLRKIYRVYNSLTRALFLKSRYWHVRCKSHSFGIMLSSWSSVKSVMWCGVVYETVVCPNISRQVITHTKIPQMDNLAGSHFIILYTWNSPLLFVFNYLTLSSRIHWYHFIQIIFWSSSFRSSLKLAFLGLSYRP